MSKAHISTFAGGEGERGNSSVAQSKTSVLMEGWGRFSVKTREKGGIISSIRKNS
jgi:hypothetical protein